MTATILGPDGAPAERVARARDALRQRVRGAVLTPSDPAFAGATRLWNAMITKTPALVVQPTGAADVVTAVSVAREHGIRLSVRGGGHNIAGTSLVDGGLTIDMSRLRGVLVDPRARTATVQPGCVLGDVDWETQLHGLATTLGFFSETGVAGLTLGGGMGYLARRFGYTVDNLLEVDIVTADGRLRRASRDEHEDLFWGVRGAGTNLGAVTRFMYRLHDVGPIVHGGLIAWPFDRADSVLDTFRQLTTSAARELTIFLIMMRGAAAPFVPAEWQGRRICAMALCYSGDLARTAQVLAPLRALGTPVFDLLRDQPYTSVQCQLDATEPKGKHYYWKTEYAADLSDDLLATMRELARECPIPAAELAFLHLGGAINEHAPDDGVVGNRDARFAYGVTGMWEPGEPRAAEFRQWVRDAWQRFRPFSTGGNYINFQNADDEDERIRATYGANYDRLVDVKTKYDPQNLFSSNRNVRPRRVDGG